MTAPAPGTPSWVDLASPDLDASRAFYSGLFGWTAEASAEPEAMGYTMFHKDGKSVAGMGTVMGDDQPPMWTTYMASDDADETAARVEKASGRVIMGPMDVMDYGRMAVFMDPTGAVFATWEAGANAGAERINEMGALCWSELATRDPATAKTFYGEVFGWTPRDLPMGKQTYTLMKLGEESVAGMMAMTDAQFATAVPPHWSPYFAVENTDQVAARAKKLGGQVTVEPTDMEAGRFAVLADPHGAAFNILLPNEDYNP